jgi:tetratricopeptide (TPR) repeat protein
MTERLLEPHIDGAAYGWFRNPLWVLERHTQAQVFTHVGIVGGHAALAAMYDDGTDIIVLSNCSPLSLSTVLYDTWLAHHGLRELETDLPHPSLSSAREFLDSGGVEGFVNYYRMLSERAGYPVKPDREHSEQVVRLLLRKGLYDDAGKIADTIAENWAAVDDQPLNTIGYLFLQEDQFDRARRYFERNAELHPRVANVFDSLGEACERQGDIEAARRHYTRAAEIARESEDRLQSFYESRLSNLD